MLPRKDASVLTVISRIPSVSCRTPVSIAHIELSWPLRSLESAFGGVGGGRGCSALGQAHYDWRLMIR